jgi:hypothetical protein
MRHPSSTVLRLPGLAFLRPRRLRRRLRRRRSGQQPPTVTLSAPRDRDRRRRGHADRDRRDSDDSVAKVEFFDGATLLGTDTGNPYSRAGRRRRTARTPHRAGDRFARRRDDERRRDACRSARSSAPTPRADGDADRPRPTSRPA